MNTNTQTFKADIENTIGFDHEASQELFNDNFERMDSGRWDSDWIYTSNDELDTELVYTVKGLKRDMVTYLNKSVLIDMEELKSLSKAELEALLRDDLETEYHMHQILSMNGDINAYDDLKDYNIALSTPFQTMTIRGYSQGDYARVFVNVDAYEKLWGCKVNLGNLRKEFRNLFFDSPINGAVTINNTEYEFWEFTADSYVYNKDELIKAIVHERCMKPHDELTKALEEIMPDELN